MRESPSQGGPHQTRTLDVVGKVVLSLAAKPIASVGPVGASGGLEECICKFCGEDRGDKYSTTALSAEFLELHLPRRAPLILPLRMCQRRRWQRDHRVGCLPSPAGAPPILARRP